MNGIRGILTFLCSRCNLVPTVLTLTLTLLIPNP
jgi:hypothetical protein